jgi:excisionase family DNA binding protein
MILMAYTIPYVRLAAAIIRQAAEDVRSGDPDALDFLLSPGGAEMLDNLGLSPGYCRRVTERIFPRATPRIKGQSLPPEDWLSVRQVAQRYSYHPERVRQLIREGKIIGIKAHGRSGWRIKAASIEAYRAGRRCPDAH